MMRPTIQSAKAWEKTTGLNTNCFQVSLVAGFLAVASGLSTILAGLGWQPRSFLVLDVDGNPIGTGAMLLGYGLLWCVACHGCFRRRRWGVGLTCFLALPAVFFTWMSSGIPAILKVLATSAAWTLTRDFKKFPEDPVLTQRTNGQVAKTV